jgi:Ca2+-binding RTX toxin-like protein
MTLVLSKSRNGKIINPYDGTENDDTIIGSAGDDWIFAAGGDDLIMGGFGADHIDGGAGRDAATYEDSNAGVVVNLQSGTGRGGTADGDRLVNVEDLYGSIHADTLIGDSGANLLRGGGGNDTLKGGGGADTLEGGHGDDLLVVDGAGDVTHGGGADDIADGGAGTDTLLLAGSSGMSVSLATGGLVGGRSWYEPGVWSPHPKRVIDIENVVGSSQADGIWGSNAANVLSGGGGDDYIDGKAGDDILDGGAGHDTLLGGKGNDLLGGGDGNDTLVGGKGADQLAGGLGRDTFVFQSLSDSTMVDGRPQDVILDFMEGVDSIDLSGLDLRRGLLTLEGQTVDGAAATFIGLDANRNGDLDEGEFAFAILVGPPIELTSGDLIV